MVTNIAASGWRRIDKVTLGSSGDISFSVVPPTFDHLCIKAQLKASGDVLTENVNLFVNGNTTLADYRRTTMSGGTAAPSGESADDASVLIANGSAAAVTGWFSMCNVSIDFYKSPLDKMMQGQSFVRESDTTQNVYVLSTFWESVATITSLTLSAVTGQLVADSFAELWGLKA